MNQRGIRAIREVTPEDADAWRHLRVKLFGEGDHAAEIAAYFAGTAAEPHAVFVAETDNGNLCALAEVSRRHEYVEGVEIYPVAYLEGWYVEPEFRRQGLGTLLITHAEKWALDAGMSQLASDAVSGNHVSLEAHLLKTLNGNKPATLSTVVAG
ncbi:MAG: N-acetyltransferase family protein [Candidatus Methylacidiphilales bacterium]|nr:GNAT family N-acetyltransferase [Candidatus Methylacidiphilales bacterium]